MSIFKDVARDCAKIISKFITIDSASPFFGIANMDKKLEAKSEMLEPTAE